MASLKSSVGEFIMIPFRSIISLILLDKEGNSLGDAELRSDDSEPEDYYCELRLNGLSGEVQTWTGRTLEQAIAWFKEKGGPYCTIEATASFQLHPNKVEDANREMV